MLGDRIKELRAINKMTQKDLAKTLKILQKEGESAFYNGKIAAAIIQDMENNGGILTQEDLTNYDIVWRTPVKGTYRGYEIISMPPPSSGGVHIIEILNILEIIGNDGVIMDEIMHIVDTKKRQVKPLTEEETRILDLVLCGSAVYGL